MFHPIADDGNDSVIILQDPGVMPVIPCFTQLKEEDDTSTIFNHDLLRIRKSTDNQESSSSWIVGDPRHKKSTPGAAKEPEVRKALQLKSIILILKIKMYSYVYSNVFFFSFKLKMSKLRWTQKVIKLLLI